MTVSPIDLLVSPHIKAEIEKFLDMILLRRRKNTTNQESEITIFGHELAKLMNIILLIRQAEDLNTYKGRKLELNDLISESELEHDIEYSIAAVNDFLWYALARTGLLCKRCRRQQKADVCTYLFQPLFQMNKIPLRCRIQFMRKTVDRNGARLLHSLQQDWPMNRLPRSITVI